MRDVGRRVPVGRGRRTWEAAQERFEAARFLGAAPVGRAQGAIEPLGAPAHPGRDGLLKAELPGDGGSVKIGRGGQQYQEVAVELVLEDDLERLLPKSVLEKPCYELRSPRVELGTGVPAKGGFDERSLERTAIGHAEQKSGEGRHDPHQLEEPPWPSPQKTEYIGRKRVAEGDRTIEIENDEPHARAIRRPA